MIKTYTHYPHGMEEDGDGDYVKCKDVADIINQFLGELDKYMLYDFLEELQQNAIN